MTATGGQKRKRDSRDDEDSDDAQDLSKALRKAEWKRRAFAAVNEKPIEIVSYGGGQSEVLFTMEEDHEAGSVAARKRKIANNKKIRAANRKLPKNKQTEIEPLAKNILEKLFEGSPDQLRGQRSFKDDRERQVLRWTATSLLTMFPKGVEVQCYYESDTVYITSNDNATNRQLAALFKQKKGNVIAAIKASYEEIAAVDSRTERHAKKLTSRAEDSTYPEQTPILECLKKGKIVVVQGSEVGLHAERRIQAKLKKKLDPDFLAGVKRPCAVCAVALELTGHCFPGPAWTSAAATQGWEADELIETLADHIEGCEDGVGDVLSYVTQMRDGSLTTGYDTESDSEAEDEDEGSNEDDDVEDEDDMQEDEQPDPDGMKLDE